MESLENKIETLSNQTTLLKQEVESLKVAVFQNKQFEGAKRDVEKVRVRDPVEKDIKLSEAPPISKKCLNLKIDPRGITYGLVGF